MNTQTSHFEPHQHNMDPDSSISSISSIPSTPSDTSAPQTIHLEHDLDYELLSRILPHANPQRRSKPCQTTLGTPCARTWDDPWIAQRRSGRTTPPTPHLRRTDHGRKPL